MLTNGLMDLKIWTCFPEVHDLKFGRASQRSMNFNLDTLPEVRWIEVWTCFSEVRWIEVWTCFPEVRWIGILDVLPIGPKIEFGHAS